MRDASDPRLFRSRIAQLIALGGVIATAARTGATAAPSDRSGITLRLRWLSSWSRLVKPLGTRLDLTSALVALACGGGLNAPSAQTVSHEPPGATIISERPFTDFVEDGWTMQASPYLSLEEDRAAPKSPPTVIQMLFPAGFGAGSSPAVAELALRSYPTTLYVSYWMKLSSNWFGQETGVNKVFHFWIGGRNRVYSLVRGAGNGPLHFEIDVQGVVAGGQFDRGTTGNLAPNLGVPATVVRGLWYQYEMVFKANTAGRADGSIEWWLNGVKVGSYRGIQFVPGDGSWEDMEWSPTWGGLGGSVPADQFMSIDHVYVSGR
ncbi:MAG: hypothetical protein DMD72_11240 [Gemmatimonadetes bacterium]|nr:MAG: hypothetical protein DMD72_11240 [Gemmatimonadota bacterium]PYO76195.1 MAG: hypothetical protein DMD63_15000 [Gemmatimonadota bacterium]